MVTASLQTALPTGVKAEDYFTGTISAGKGIDALFDTYKITIDPVAGITVKTKDAGTSTVLTIPAATVAANTSQPLPTIVDPTATLPANTAPVANTGTAENVGVGTVTTLDGSASSYLSLIHI